MQINLSGYCSANQNYTKSLHLKIAWKNVSHLNIALVNPFYISIRFIAGTENEREGN